MEIDDRTFLPIGTTLDRGRFVIEAKAGSGGFGLTYRARDNTNNGALVAIKEYFPYGLVHRERLCVVFDKTLEPKYRPQNVAFAEAQSTDEAIHPAVPSTIRTFLENDTAYITMDWVEGQTLTEYCSAGAVDAATLLKVYLTSLDAVLHFAARNMAHRDLNPNNILIRSDGEPIIIDFGLARRIGRGFTTATRTPFFMSGFEPPEQWLTKSWQDIWTDIFTLSASIYFAATGWTATRDNKGSLLQLLRDGHVEADGMTEQFAATIDRGLLPGIRDRLKSGHEALKILDLTKEDLQQILSAEVFESTLLFDRPKPLPYEPGDDPQPVRHQTALQRQYRYQRSLLQSFDTARFQPTSVKRKDGTSLATTQTAKIALARTEAALNLLFGREIIVPAGQIAESPAFMTIFMEIMDPYLERYSGRIDEACTKKGMPPFKPFRLALEKQSMIDYIGFINTYKFTGAPLIILKSAGADAAQKQEEAIAKIEGFKALFLAKEYAKLEAAIKRPGYERFARMVATWFGPQTSVFAKTDIAEVSANEYARVFSSRLGDERLSGDGVSEARDSLNLVKEIEAKLGEDNVSGYRGNWYLFAEQFGDVWPLARAYLDMRLFLTLSQQYSVDHPIFISQEFEYGRFDHSLILGPQFSDKMAGDDQSPLLEVASHFEDPINWSAVLELFLDDKFLTSVQRLNRHFFQETSGAEQEYVEDIGMHGILLNQMLGKVFEFSTDEGRLTLKPVSADNGEKMSYEAYDPQGLSPQQREKDRIATESMFPDDSIPNKDLTAVKTLQTTKDGTAFLGDAMAETVLHYYAKPYRSFVENAR